MHTSGYEYAVKNGYKKSKQEWIEEQLEFAAEQAHDAIAKAKGAAA